MLKGCLLWLSFASLNTLCQSKKLHLPPQNFQDCEKEIPCKRREDLSQQSCPEGFHCSGLPSVSCPPGTFLSSKGPHNSSNCRKCPQGFFNHWPGQDACFPCGSEATQSEEGQDTCICQGFGRVFQPSDGQCPCFPGYQDVGEPSGCVQQEYGICKDGATRNQEGQCLTKEEWTNHCAQEVCATSRDAHGYDSLLGLCLCWGMDLNEECGPPCQERQRHILQLTCHKGIPQISSIDDDDERQFSYFLDRPLSPRAAGFPCTYEQNSESSPVYVIKTEGRGFLGLTRPGPELFYSLPQSLRNPRPPVQVPDSSLEPSSDETLKSFLWALNLSSKEPGILNPIACIHIHDTLAFLVTREHYPEYDLGHLYNTVREYDWGDFRALAESILVRLHSPFLFLHQFQQPGVYVFRLNSNKHRKMYIRALPPEGQCFRNGPFVPTTPRYLIQTGIAKTPTPNKKPDWPVVLGLIFLLLGLCLLLLAQSHGLGWTRKSTSYPLFRIHQQKYNMEIYSSPETLLTSVRQGQAGQGFLIPRIVGHHGECWEAEEQLDLEYFDTNTFFRLLQRQSLSVTAKLSQTKEEVKLLYLKLLKEVSSLRELWYMKLRIPTANDLRSIQKDQQQIAQATAKEAEEEARRRQGLADEYAESLRQQLKLLRQDLRARELQWAAFGSALKEAQRLLTAKTDPTSEKTSQPIQNIDKKSQVDAAIDRLSQVLLNEGKRLKAWGILGTGTGAELLHQGDTSGVPDITCMKPITRLLVPGPNCAMLPTNGYPGPIPPGYFIHPGTGKLLPEAGNLGYDLLNATLVPTTDVTAGIVRTTKSPILSYISYPICPATSTPVTTCLPALQSNRTSQLGGLMTDPATGLEVPVLAVTVHPETGQWLAIGGTYCNPLTKTLAPIEMGGPMEDPITGSISPILGVGLDENTGEVLLLGGLRDTSGSLLLPGDCFVEPLSGKSAWLRGACLQEGRIVPHAGGPQALLDANVLAAQMHMMEVLQKIRESPGLREYGKMEVTARDLRQSLSLSLYHLLHQVQRLERQLKAASDIKVTGGKMGMIQYPGTKVWMPAVFGMKIPDPAGSGLLVPILGMKCNWNSGQFILLAGTMEDANGKGLIPISIGAQTIDPITGKPGPVIGAQIDPNVGVVVPIVQVLGVLPRGVEDSNLTVLLEKELGARELYWCHQQENEERLIEDLQALSQEFLETHNWDTPLELLPQDRLRVVEQICCDMEFSSLQEAQRRARVLMPYPLKSVLLSQADRKEWEQEAQVILGVQRVLQRLEQAMEKLRQEGCQLHGQEKEMWRQSKYQSKQGWHRTIKVVLQLSGEFQALVRETLSSLDEAISQLQYIRDLNHLQLLQIQILISRNPVCLENYPGGRFYGEDAVSLRDGAVACPLLAPLVKSFTQMLKGAQSHYQDFKDEEQKTDFKNVFQRHPHPQASWRGELVPMNPSDLSAREFVIYQHGLSMLQFLTPQINAPEITIHIASRLPAIHAPGNAFHNSFFYQKDQNKLFILRECLASVGSFSLLLIHCLAHIAAADLYQDSNPVFLKLFYEGLKACLSDAFSVKLQMSAIFQDKKPDQCITAILLKGEPTSEETDLLSKLIDTKVKSYMDPESPEESMKKNKYHLLFTSLEHFLKNKLSLEQQILTEDTISGINKSSDAKGLPHFNSQEKKELDSLMQQLTKFLKKEDDF